MLTALVAGVMGQIIVSDTVRPWLGPHYWANPAEDWQSRNGRFENTHSGGDRNVVSLTSEITDKKGDLVVEARFTRLSENLSANGFAGFEIGLQGEFDDYRDSAIYGNGFQAGFDAKGNLFLGRPESSGEGELADAEVVDLRLVARPSGDDYSVSLTASVDGKEVAETTRHGVDPSWLRGLVAVCSSSRMPQDMNLFEPRGKVVDSVPQARGGEFRFGIDRFKVGGSKTRVRLERKFGPVLWTTYTKDNDGNLYLLVQGAPFARDEELDVTLALGSSVDYGRYVDDGEVERLEGIELFESRLDPVSRTARFAIRSDYAGEFTVKFNDYSERFVGRIRKAPTDRGVIASMSCNDADGFPHVPLVKNVADQNPDVLAFLGDQIYERVGGYGLIYDQEPNDRAVICYLRKYAMHGWTWRELMRDRPTINIPDDHDVFHGNLWGAGGKAADVSRGFGNFAQDSGGYKMSVEFVNAVHRTQTGNLPPAVSGPTESGITTYFTDLQYGPFDFAILGDRQFKSAPNALVTATEISNGWPESRDFDAQKLADVEGAELLGSAQEAFLDHWAGNGVESSPFRVVVSQSPWLCPQTLPEDVQNDSAVPGLPIYKAGEFAPNDVATPDFDSNAWPQTPRTRALRMVDRAGALHITGDQHLGSTGQYGLDAFDDGPWWISNPAIANIWPRRWMPKDPALVPFDPPQQFLGSFKDKFGNLFTLHGVSNPVDVEMEPSRLFDRAVGYAIVRFDAGSRTMSLENWPYMNSPKQKAPLNVPYEHWPVVVDYVTRKRVRGSGGRVVR